MLELAEAKKSSASYFYREDRPLIIAHRGSFMTYPEHTIGSYLDAYYSGSDFLELDLQVTKDLQLIVQHDKTLE